ncbi:TetR family transcriptional regulator C-terminal domain-containing protein [Halobellus sp. GM3]|uniref:TetR family transcriptional regulator C-terminal domain-containing protein n=1 Tax=Halobellus sp. GM3 TaxID=3458410 RepID=UPI00403D9F1D
MTNAPTDILHATHSALRKNGYAELTMQDIADETDLSKASIHYHYDCKHDLLVAFLDHLYERFTARIEDPDGESPSERLRSLVDTVVTDRPENSAFQTALLEIKAQSPYDDAFRERLRRFDDTFAAAAREIVAEGVAEGAFRDDVDPDAVASFLTTYVNGAQVRYVSVGHPLEVSAAEVHAYIDETVLAESDPAPGESATPPPERADTGGSSE